MNRWSWLGLVTVMGIAGAYGCSGGGTDDVAQGDASDIIQAADTTTCDGFAPQEPDSSMPTCYRATTCDNTPFCPSLVTNDPMHPKFVIAQIDVLTPTVLGPRMPVGSILNNAIVGGKFFWGLDVDLTAMTVRTGTMLTDMPEQPGAGYLTNNFRFITGAAPAGDGGSTSRWDPVMGTVTVTGDTFSTNPFSIVTVPIYGTPNDAGQATLLAELPLRRVSMHDVRMTSNHNCIGLAKARYASCLQGLWYTSDPTTDAGMNSFGVLEGDLTVADADQIIVVDIPGMPTLCGLIAGTGSNCSVPPAMWRTPAEATASGPGWHLVANFSGYAAHIQ